MCPAAGCSAAEDPASRWDWSTGSGVRWPDHACRCCSNSQTRGQGASQHQRCPVEEQGEFEGELSLSAEDGRHLGEHYGRRSTRRCIMRLLCCMGRLALAIFLVLLSGRQPHEAVKLFDSTCGYPGEGPALHPACLGVANVTSLSPNTSLIEEHDVLLIQEARSDLHERARLSKRYKIHFGAGEKALVAIAARSGDLGRVLLKLPQGWDERVVAACWRHHNQTFLLFSIYILPALPVEERRQLRSVIECICEEVAVRGHPPTRLAGDFNFTCPEVAGLDLLQREGWKDLDCGVTCITANTERPRRIDLCFANLAYQRLVQKVEARWDMGIATHACQQHTLHTGPPVSCDAACPKPSFMAMQRGAEVDAAPHCRRESSGVQMRYRAGRLVPLAGLGRQVCPRSVELPG